ncbi:MarR family winged helix-turn-helix transcriptional regulator [Nocardia bovistercoris]|uniref:Winged helix-turn-helix transcriptional regulator n=1 Tax=Nocardia bovistercoris TaxID=2785916 RepID=A0A931N1X0_9NOCA|nr:MarR family winged helix-turn-helix transcriptional regulator [Nocardia bovistercoris]MBH0776137.1 winged helix-turn-helix transcriptional regulator [Nocardia bovistercoris]
MELEETPTRLRNKPTWLISKAAVRAHRLIGEAMAAVDGRAYHFAILAALDEFGPDSQVRIGRRCGIDQSDMHAMLGELTAQGHVARTSDPSDRRRNLITVTPSGRQRLEELDSTLSTVQNDLLVALSATDRKQLATLLARVLE